MMFTFIVGFLCVFASAHGKGMGSDFHGTNWQKAMGWCNHAGSELHVGDFNGDGRADMLCHDTKGNKWVLLANAAGQFTGNSWHKAMGWCNHAGAELHVGDFNGDGRADMLCHDTKGNKWVALANAAGQFTGNSWHSAMGWCYHAGAELHVGDFNGDGRADMLCHDTKGDKWVALANTAGQFTSNSWYNAMGWCYHAGAELHVGDFNGDGRADMLCHDTKGDKWVALSNAVGKFTGNSWHKAMGWCYHAGAELHVGDFNGDGRADMLCHDTKGSKWIAVANAAGQFTGNSWHKAMGWCNHAGSELHVGDFNGDRRADMLCHDTKGYKWVALAMPTDLFTGKSWHKNMGWCNHAGSELHVGDFNGDGRADMLCHDTKGSKWVLLANAAGQFTGNSWHYAMGWCNHAGSELHIGDFNGDGRADMLCHDTKGSKWIALANVAGQFTGNSWHNAMGWCNHAGSELHVGDFNGDGRADMLCHDTKGSKWVLLANGAGQFTGNSWHNAMGWCNHAGSELHVGDFNGDGRADMLCHDTKGNKWVALANAAGQFTGNSWHSAMGWCNHAGAELHLGDFNGDGRADMLCHDTKGNKWVALANAAGQFTGNSWYKAMGWCNHAGSELHVGDFNGDRRADMLCHDTKGNKWVALAGF